MASDNHRVHRSTALTVIHSLRRCTFSKPSPAPVVAVAQFVIQIVTILVDLTFHGCILACSPTVRLASVVTRYGYGLQLIAFQSHGLYYL